MPCARFVGLLLLASLPVFAHASVGDGGIDDTIASLRSSAEPEPIGVTDCDGANALRRLSGCSALINSGELTGGELARAYRNRAMALFSLGEKERAILDFDQAISLDSDDASLFLARGTTWQHLDEHARALEDLTRAVELDPANAAAYGNLGVAWEKLGDDQRALANYDRSLKLEPENAIVLNNRGNVLSRMGERRKAIADYDRALQLDPDYASAYYNRAGELCLEGRAGPAVSDYLHAIRLGARQRAALESFLSRQGYYEGAADPNAADLEPALRQWSQRACAQPATESARTGDAPGRVGAHPG